jgi:hypothetical protein
MKFIAILLLGAAATATLAQPSRDSEKGKSSIQASTAVLDRMIASGKSPQELAQYVFDTHGCKSCHTIGREGKLGFTENGQKRATGFEGCINMLTAMTVIVHVREDKRSSQQREKAARFGEFGCTACHNVTPGKLSLTEVGTKLQHLHLGCVDIEKLTFNRAAPQHWDK